MQNVSFNFIGRRLLGTSTGKYLIAQTVNTPEVKLGLMSVVEETWNTGWEVAHPVIDFDNDASDELPPPPRKARPTATPVLNMKAEGFTLTKKSLPNGGFYYSEFGMVYEEDQERTDRYYQRIQDEYRRVGEKAEVCDVELVDSKGRPYISYMVRIGTILVRYETYVFSYLFLGF